MAGWAPPRGDYDLVVVDEVCPTCGQHIDDHPPVGTATLTSGPGRPWLLAAAAGLVLVIGAVAAVTRSGHVEPSTASATTSLTATTAVARTPTTQPTTTTARPALTTRPPLATTTTAPPAPPVLAVPGDLPSELSDLSLVVGGRLVGETWIVALDGSSIEPLWIGGSRPQGPFNVIESAGGLLIVTEFGTFLRSDAGIARLDQLARWGRPGLTSSGFWLLRESSGLGQYGVLEHRTLDGVTLLEEAALPTWGWLLGTWRDRPVFASHGVTGGTYLLDTDGVPRRIAAGRAVHLAAGRLLETLCDDRLVCRLRLIDLDTGTSTDVQAASPGGELQVMAAAADGSAVVVASWQTEVTPISVNLNTGEVRSLHERARGELQRALETTDWGPVTSIGAAVDPSGRFLLSASRGGIAVVDIDTDRQWTIGIDGGSARVTPLGSGAS